MRANYEEVHRVSIWTKRIRSVKHPELEKALSLWLDQLENSQFISLTEEMIREVGVRFCDQLQIPGTEGLQLSNEWFENFKQRQGLKFYRF